MSADFSAIDALLASVTEETPLPGPDERRRLREDARLSKAQVARALAVSPSTVGGWETGREPTGDVRERYAYLLEQLRAKLAPSEPEPEPESKVPAAGDDATGTGDADVVPLPSPQPCVLCGAPARHEVEGFAQHLDPADCATAAAPRPPELTASPPAAAPRPPEPTASPSPPAAAPRPSTPDPRPRTPARRAFQDPSRAADLVTEAVAAALAAHEGDVDAAAAGLIRKAIPDAMALLEACRNGGRYDVIGHPPLPDILRKRSKNAPDAIWEARPKWTRDRLPPGAREITALDVNGAYLSALKTHLPIGALEHAVGAPFDRRRSGLYLITPPDWDHGDLLPNPLGDRDEPGELWVTDATLRLLLAASGRLGLCDPPVVHESYTSGSTEGLLEKFRLALVEARAEAIASGDELTLEYVKAMYSKFVATMGESHFNRELYRPDWMHIIRSQAFANLWMKAHRAYDHGLTVVRVMGTDELHLSGDWRAVFAEGRAVTEVKVKDVYTAGRPAPDAPPAEDD